MKAVAAFVVKVRFNAIKELKHQLDRLFMLCLCLGGIYIREHVCFVLF